MFYGVKSDEAQLCAKLRKVYRDVMLESSNLLVYFGDAFGEKLLSTVNPVSPAAPAALNIGTL